MTDTGLGAEFRGIVLDANIPQLRKNIAAFWKRHHGEAAAVSAALIALWDNDSSTDARMGIAMTLGLAADTVPGRWSSYSMSCHEMRTGWSGSHGQGFRVVLFDTWLGAFAPGAGPMAPAPASARAAGAAEGPRVWTKRRYFTDHPSAALRLFGELRAPIPATTCASRSAMRSPIPARPTPPDLTLEWLGRWSGEPEAAWVLARACRHLLTSRAEPTKRLLAAVKDQLT